MSREEIRNRMAAFLAEILDREEVILSDATVADAVEGWDSLAHMKLLVALESDLNISFKVSELSGARDVGELVDLVQSKLAG
jgi:acyl carrier protein